MVHTISKSELVSWYDVHWHDMAPFIVGHYVTGINAHGIFVRNNATNPIVINGKEELLTWVQQKYMTQIIPELPLIDHQEETNVLLVDIDSPFSLDQNKIYAAECFQMTQKNISKVLKPKPFAEFTGGRSFHIRVEIDRFIPWEDAKELVEETIIAPFYEKYGDNVTFPATMRMPSRDAKKAKLHLDMSSMKKRGAVRCVYSFYKDTAQYAYPLPTLADIKNFTIEKATFKALAMAVP